LVYAAAACSQLVRLTEQSPLKRPLVLMRMLCTLMMILILSAILAAMPILPPRLGTAMPMVCTVAAAQYTQARLMERFPQRRTVPWRPPCMPRRI